MLLMQYNAIYVLCNIFIQKYGPFEQVDSGRWNRLKPFEQLSIWARLFEQLGGYQNLQHSYL